MNEIVNRWSWGDDGVALIGRAQLEAAIAPLLEEHKVVLDSYAEENQRLFDRAEKAEVRVKELEAELGPHPMTRIAPKLYQTQLAEEIDKRRLDDIRHLRARVKEFKKALDHAEAVMSIVEPRSDKKEYLECLEKIRAALRH